MNKNFNCKNGVSIKIITEKIKREIEKNDLIKSTTRKVKKPSEIGKLTVSDLKNISIGIDFLSNLAKEGFNKQIQNLMLGDKDISKVKKNTLQYSSVIQDFLKRLSIGSRDEQYIREKIESLSDYSQIAQAATDGIIIKQEKRTETVNGEKKEIIYDTGMSSREAIDILVNYERVSDRLMREKLNNYLGIGLGLAGAIGVGLKENKEKESKDKGIMSLMTITTIAKGGLRILQEITKQKDREKYFELRDEGRKMIDDLLYNEQISSNAEKSTIEGIKTIVMQERNIDNKIEDKRFAFALLTDLSIALLYGAYINKNVAIKENGKIDGKSLAKAIAEMQANNGIVSCLVRSMQGIIDSQKEEQEFEEACKKVKSIMEQMEEKVYPLEGAKHPFNSISINDFTGKFYPKKDYETGEIKYGTTISVSEFSMQRGDVVLLSGESGTGKSTFLRLLKRGDINNRRVIKLDNEELVDHLGDEYVSFRPSINLGEGTNVLCQITGKKNISDLTEKEKNNLLNILKEMKFNETELLEELASKNFMEFSSGQQRRLALSKVFYRIDDGTSVIIVDEPVGNVQDNLIREQLEMIKKYAQKKNAMMILTTHRIDLAQDLATKRYNISQEGVLEEIPIKQKEMNER